MSEYEERREECIYEEMREDCVYEEIRKRLHTHT